MRFVLVNGRTLSRQSFCVLCSEPIDQDYLRDIGTRHCYCDFNCYALHCDRSAVVRPEDRAKAS